MMRGAAGEARRLIKASAEARNTFIGLENHGGARDRGAPALAQIGRRHSCARQLRLRVRGLCRPLMLDRRTFLGTAAASVIGFALLRAPGRTEAAASFKVMHSDAEWLRILGRQRYDVLRHAGAERAFTSPLLNEHRRGVFACAGCALPLFSSATKFESGTGWPSFWRALAARDLCRTRGPQPSDGADRSALLEVRRSPGSCLRRWAGADRTALLHEWLGAQLPINLTSTILHYLALEFRLSVGARTSGPACSAQSPPSRSDIRA